MKKRTLYPFVPVFLMAILFSPLTISSSSSSAIITIPPSAFQPITNCDFHNGGGAIYSEAGNPCLDFHAPVYLPQGVTATKLIFYWRDLSASGNGVCGLFREDNYGGIYTGYGMGYTQGSDIYYSSTTVDLTGALINYSSGGYFIYCSVPADTMLFSVQLEYNYSAYLSTIFR